MGALQATLLIVLWQQASRCQTYDTRHRCHTQTTGVKQWPKPSNGRLDDAAGQDCPAARECLLQCKALLRVPARLDGTL